VLTYIDLFVISTFPCMLYNNMWKSLVGGGDVAIAGVAHMTSVQTEYHILLGRDEQWWEYV